MAENIDVNSGGIASSLGSFQSKMSEMQTLMQEIMTDTNNAKSYWEGTASTAVLGQIEQLQQVFSSIDAQNQVYVNFLNSVIDNYTTADNQQTTAVESNEANFSVTD